MLIKFILYILISSLFIAQAEIHIEGADGWASKLPTWKIKNKFTKLILGNTKFLTGYHLYFWSSIFVLLHSSFIITGWNLQKELILVSCFFLLTSTEDFLWFVLNPHFGIKKFKKEYIPWHQSWFGPLPTGYYLSTAIAVLLLYLSGV
ncbi:hypothetical protein JXA63_04195 [Candidatus Woesebacteria bacterium]|nr:hypothetical protein [Candidatus Woesebacteria bacterium]